MLSGTWLLKKEAKIKAKFEAKRACVVLEKVLSVNIKAKFRYSSFYIKTTVTELFLLVVCMS